MSDDSILQLLTTCVARLVPLRGVGIAVTALVGQVTHLQASKVEGVRDASGSEGDRVDVVDCDPFPKRKLDLDSEAF